MATSAFGKAFRAARDAGDKEFEFGGKKYNTKLKEETSAPALVNTSRYVSPNDRETYKAQERADQGLNETGTRFLNSDKGRQTYEESGKGTVDRQNAAKYGYGAKPQQAQGMKHGGSVKMAKGGSASNRGDGIAQRGKTRGKFC
jgi:hypothetical protein